MAANISWEILSPRRGRLLVLDPMAGQLPVQEKGERVLDIATALRVSDLMGRLVGEDHFRVWRHCPTVVMYGSDTVCGGSAVRLLQCSNA
jgi:hypothetical protein